MTIHLTTTWLQPIPAADLRKGMRASDGYARRFRSRLAARIEGSGVSRGAVVPTGILLKEGET